MFTMHDYFTVATFRLANFSRNVWMPTCLLWVLHWTFIYDSKCWGSPHFQPQNACSSFITAGIWNRFSVHNDRTFDKSCCGFLITSPRKKKQILISLMYRFSKNTRFCIKLGSSRMKNCNTSWELISLRKSHPSRILSSIGLL